MWNDDLLLNEEWHQSNFGAVRSADTLYHIWASSLFGGGLSLWFTSK